MLKLQRARRRRRRKRRFSIFILILFCTSMGVCVHLCYKYNGAINQQAQETPIILLRFSPSDVRSDSFVRIRSILSLGHTSWSNGRSHYVRTLFQIDKIENVHRRSTRTKSSFFRFGLFHSFRFHANQIFAHHLDTFTCLTFGIVFSSIVII